MREWLRLLPILALLFILPGCVETSPLLEPIADEDIEQLKAYFRSEEQTMDNFPRALRIKSNLSHRDALRLKPVLHDIVSAALSSPNKMSENKVVSLVQLVLLTDPSAVPAELLEKLLDYCPQGPDRIYIRLLLSPTKELRQAAAQEFRKELEAKAGKPLPETDSEALEYLVDRTLALEEKVGASADALPVLAIISPRKDVITKLILAHWEKADDRGRTNLLGLLAQTGPAGRPALPTIRAHALANKGDVALALHAVIGMNLPNAETAREVAPLLNHESRNARKLTLQVISNFNLYRELTPEDAKHVAAAASYREPDPEVLQMARALLDAHGVEYSNVPPKEVLDANADAFAILRKYMDTDAITAQEFADGRRLLLAERRRMNPVEKTMRGLYDDLASGLLDPRTFKSKMEKALEPDEDWGF